MTEVFGTLYGSCYDTFYATKDYEAECDLLEAAFERFGDGPIESVLDLGCGTGGHALPLSRRGYRVTGVDRAAEMLATARRKVASDGPEFVEGDLQSLDLGRSFDACLMMFAVLGYQAEEGAALAGLRTAGRHLRPGGLFACDVWYGPAVLRERPSDRARTFKNGEGEVIRFVRSELDVFRQVVAVRCDLWSFQPGKGVERTAELHAMRFFFPEELRLLFAAAGLELLGLSAFSDLNRTPSESDWNVFAVARRSRER